MPNVMRNCYEKLHSPSLNIDIHSLYFVKDTAIYAHLGRRRVQFPLLTILIFIMRTYSLMIGNHRLEMLYSTDSLD